MPFPRVMNHPDVDKIMRLLLKGKGVRTVAKMLKDKYPDNPKLCISKNTLQKFRSEHLKLDGDALDKIKKQAKSKTKKMEKKKEHTKVKNLPSYKKQLQTKMDSHLDIRKSLLEIDTLIKSRLEDMFNKAQSGTASIKEEQLLQGYFDRYFVLIEKWAKYIDHVADVRVDTNINVTVIQDQMATMRRVIMKVMNRMDPDKAIEFLHELNQEMGDFEYRRPKQPSLGEIQEGIKAIPIATVESPNGD